ncbi:MAG: hypothetical protein DI533_15050 [Cereibacter sphaeroides]|uniref:Phage holin family protein n=1 Tax=Cereibacter sphaeroides TaxID=1063 RepID=A0A2W5S608_CERSP|nr:MAG: hypothetical protein DI533_15050 [Cereibacter sphaeroides]
MKRYALTALTYLIANAVALLLTAFILGPGFTINFTGFLLAVLIFTAVQALAKPMLEMVSARNLPQLMGSISLIAVFLGLWIADLANPGMTIDGVSNWLAATFIVWLISLIVEIALPFIAFPSMRAPKA